MRISKEGRALSGGTPDEQELALIQSFARSELSAEEVYTFPVILCDNEVDRDYERFDVETLEELAGLFVGKTGIFDHEWRSGNQVARIYRTELTRDETRRTAAGEGYVGLKAWAYMLRTEANAELIASIEGGIRKEVSVAVSVRETLCGICGGPIGGEGCAHVRGERYGGALCCATLHGAVDAYEWSFVAVPAQRGAGVTKAVTQVKTLAAGEYASLKRDAALGRRYLSELRGEVKRLSLLCGKDFYNGVVAPELGTMGADALLRLRSYLETQAANKIPLRTQLPGSEEIVRFDGEAFKI